MHKLIVFSVEFFLIQIMSQTDYSQTFDTWKGGTPGQETNCACSRNWSLSRIPDEFNRLIIPKVFQNQQINTK